MKEKATTYRLYESDCVIGVIEGNIAEAESVGVIVNPTDRKLSNTGKTSKVILKKAGEGLEKACKAVGKCKKGEVVVTGAYDIPVSAIFHTNVPKYDKDTKEEVMYLDTLAKCYKKILEKAEGEEYRDIAIPLLGTGGRKYPLEKAIYTAVKATKEHYDEQVNRHESLGGSNMDIKCRTVWFVVGKGKSEKFEEIADRVMSENVKPGFDNETPYDV